MRDKQGHQGQELVDAELNPKRVDKFETICSHHWPGVDIGILKSRTSRRGRGRGNVATEETRYSKRERETGTPGRHICMFKKTETHRGEKKCYAQPKHPALQNV